MAPRRWTKHGSKLLGQHTIFRLLGERYESPRTGATLDAVIIEPADWVNVVALTPDERCVMIRQYRFGSDSVTLEVPGGMIDPGEVPSVAAERELREETGYGLASLTALGSIAPNPAFQRNRLHMFLAEGCALAGEQQQDSGEDIEVELIELSKIDTFLASGVIEHALVAVVFQRLSLFRRGLSVG
jgi:ADP-ribose pyrophosphatase